MKVYIDESGTLSLNNSEKYFILTAILCDETNCKKLKQLHKNIYKKYLVPNKLKEIHACKMTFVEKQGILNSISQVYNLKVFYLVANKEKIFKRLINNQNLCYNYLVGILVSKIIEIATEDIEVMIDNHSTKVGSLNSLHDYLKMECYAKSSFNFNFNSRFVDSHKDYGIQIVDLISNSIFSKYNHSKNTLYNINLNIYTPYYFPKIN